MYLAMAEIAMKSQEYGVFCIEKIKQGLKHIGNRKHMVVNDDRASMLFCFSIQRRHTGRDGFLKSPASRLFTQPFIQTHIKENIKAPHHWPLCGEFTWDL